MKRAIVTTRRRRLSFGDNRGLILPLTLLVMVILGALAAAILSIGGSEAMIASNHLRTVQAEFLAEAGLEHAFNTLRTSPTLMKTSFANLATSALQNLVSNPSVSGGSYTVQYQQAGAYTVRVVSIGTIGGSQQIRRAVMSTFFQTRNAINSNGPLAISGSTSVSSTNGTCGNIHANGTLTLSGGGGGLHIYGDATSTGTYTENGTVQVDGDHDADPEPAQSVPHIDPVDYLNFAKNDTQGGLANHLENLYQLTVNADGKGEVRNGNGTLLTATPLNDGDTWGTCGWKYDAAAGGEDLATWRLTSTTPCNGTYYFAGNVDVSQSAGSPTDSWKTTLIATGDIDISSEPTIGNDPALTLHETLFIAGRDIKIHGNPSNSVTYNGLIAAREQFNLGGTLTVTGFVIGENGGSASNTVISNNVTGNVTLTYNCGANPPLQGPLTILSWGL